MTVNTQVAPVKRDARRLRWFAVAALVVPRLSAGMMAAALLWLGRRPGAGVGFRISLRHRCRADCCC